MADISELVKRHFHVDDYHVLGFFEEYSFLSNFYKCSVTVDGVTYPSSEHAYMAEKTTDKLEKQKIANIPKCSDVKKYGSGEMIISKPYWDEYRLIAMMKVLMAKFTQNPDLRDKLLATGNKTLSEVNWWNDKFWGEDEKGEGKTMLGECLMAVRSLIKESTRDENQA